MALDPRVRKMLNRAGLSVRVFRATVEARRPKIIAARGITTMLDVGGNVGQYASTLRDAGFQGCIVSFEPVLAAYSELRARADADPMWEARRIAVGAEAGEITIHVSANTVHSSVLPIRDDYVTIDPGASYQASEKVPMQTLDALAAEHAPDGTLGVKIDVQGFESAVLDGATETLARAAVIEMELLLVPSYEGETLAPALLDRMFDAGFRLGLVENIMEERDGTAMAMNGLFVRA